MKIQFHRIDTNVVVGLLVREFCCSGTDVSAKVLAMYADTRTPPMEPQWLAAGLSQSGLTRYNGTWYYIDHGVLNWKYTGLTYYVDCWYYVENGILTWKYTGVTKYYGTWYYVQNSAINWKYSGTFTQKGHLYQISYGIVVG